MGHTAPTPPPSQPEGPEHQDRLGLLARIALAFAAFWRVLLHPGAAAQVRDALQGPAATPTLPAPTPGPESKTGAMADAKTQSPADNQADNGAQDAVLHFLGALQREGRFVDFIAEDLPPSVPDADIGAAARMVHRGCRKALDAWVHIEPILDGDEGTPITVPPGFDSRAIALTGDVRGEPPFHGTLAHHGWRATEVRLPLLSDAADPSVLATAEVEL